MQLHEVITVVRTYCMCSVVYTRTDTQPCILKGHQQQNTSAEPLSFCVMWCQLWGCLITLMKKKGKKKKLIMWHQSEAHYELWMNFSLADEILSREVGRDNIVYRGGG